MPPCAAQLSAGRHLAAGAVAGEAASEAVREQPQQSHRQEREIQAAATVAQQFILMHVGPAFATSLLLPASIYHSLYGIFKASLMLKMSCMT